MKLNFIFKKTSIDTMASQKSSTLRHQIYNYLETKLPCTKQTILMRAKKIRIQKEENKTGVILRRLKIAVDAVMPQELTRHEEECKRVIERREALAIIGSTDNPEHLLKMPKKRFPWTETTKFVHNTLCYIFLFNPLMF